MLEGYYFTDCLILDLSVAPDLSAVQLVSEVQCKTEADPAWRFGQIKIRLSQVEELQITVKGGFHADLDTPVGYKGNEIYEFRFEAISDEKVKVVLASDLLLLTAICPEAGVKHVLLT